MKHHKNHGNHRLLSGLTRQVDAKKRFLYYAQQDQQLVAGVAELFMDVVVSKKCEYVTIIYDNILSYLKICDISWEWMIT